MPPAQEPETLPPLHRAARNGDIAAIRGLVSEGADLEERSPENMTPLMVAALHEHGTAEAVKTLLELGSDPRALADRGETALWFAAASGDAARVKVLLEAGGNPNDTADNGWMALGVAAGQGDAESVRLLLQAGASPNPVGETPEHTAAFAARIASLVGPNGNLARLTGEKPAEASAFYSFQIPLFQAAEGGSAECIRLLLAAGASPHQRDNSAGTALMYAASAEAVDALVEAGCDLHVRDQFSNGALDHALQNGHPEVLRALVAAGADLEARDQNGNTALLGFCAAMEVDAAMVRALLDAGADLHARTHQQRTALHQAAQLWNGDRRDKLGAVIRVLVAAGLPVDVRDKQGRTPLHLAVDDEGGDVSAVKALLELGADVNAADRHGTTPLIVAVANCHNATEIVPILLAAGADPARTDHAGRTALDAAHARLKIWEQIVADPGPESLRWFTPEQREQRHLAALENAREVLAVLEEL